MYISQLFIGLLAVPLVTSHADHDYQAEQLQRRQVLDSYTRRDLSHCAEKIKARGIEARNIKRRTQLAADLLKKRNLQGI
jgi:hypothetical protein